MGNLPDFDTLWNYSKPAETEQTFRRLLPTAQQSDDTNYHAELLTQIARTQGLQQQFDNAHATLDQVKSMLTDNMHRANVRYFLERGRAFNSSQQQDKARPLFIQAWELAKQHKQDRLAVDAAHMVAIVEGGESALEWNLKALDYAENSDQAPAKKWLGSLYNNIGWTYHDMQDYDSALNIFKKAERWQAEFGTVTTQRIATWCVARTLRALGQIEDALDIHLKQLQLYEDDGEKPGFTYEEIAECLYALDRNDEAKPFFAKAYAQLSQDQWLIRDEPERLQRLQTLST